VLLAGRLAALCLLLVRFDSRAGIRILSIFACCVGFVPSTIEDFPETSWPICPQGNAQHSGAVVSKASHAHRLLHGHRLTTALVRHKSSKI